MTPSRWAIITGEYPLQAGGVADYTGLVARRLADVGDVVTVYAPWYAGEPNPTESGVEVVRLPDHFGPRGLLALDTALVRRPLPDRILVQYVPHAFGYKAMNLPFAAWIAARACRIAPVWAMFHEVAFPFSWQPVKHAALATATRIMARLVVGAAERVFVSIPAWGEFLKRLCPRMRQPEWLPVPCNLPIGADAAMVAAVSGRSSHHGGFLAGHFGTYGSSTTDLLGPAVAELSRLAPNACFLLLGRGGEQFREQYVESRPELACRIAATGELSSSSVSAHLRACDLLVQPFPDGVSSRRTSAMAGLANGVPLVTNLGALSEPLWGAKGITEILTPDPVAIARMAASLLADPTARIAHGRRGETLYREMFAMEHTIAKLRGDRE